MDEHYTAEILQYSIHMYKWMVLHAQQRRYLNLKLIQCILWICRNIFAKLELNNFFFLVGLGSNDTHSYCFCKCAVKGCSKLLKENLSQNIGCLHGILGMLPNSRNENVHLPEDAKWKCALLQNRWNYVKLQKCFSVCLCKIHQMKLCIVEEDMEWNWAYSLNTLNETVHIRKTEAKNIVQLFL
jgi:hypothetical protein